jgi:citrate synthase
MSKVEIHDSLTDQTLQLDLNKETIDSKEFLKLGISVYDNGYLNTAVCKSKITYIDGTNGILQYRGYAIEDLAENSSFLEVSYLLIFGELPTEEQFKKWETRIMRHTFIHENLVDYLRNFRYDAHPMVC